MKPNLILNWKKLETVLQQNHSICSSNFLNDSLIQQVFIEQLLAAKFCSGVGRTVKNKIGENPAVIVLIS